MIDKSEILLIHHSSPATQILIEIKTSFKLFTLSSSRQRPENSINEAVVDDILAASLEYVNAV